MIHPEFNIILKKTCDFDIRSALAAKRRQIQVIGRFIPIGAIALTCLGAVYRPSPVVPPKPSREMRAAWIATVSNIDWPSTNGLSTAQQKAELLAIMDRARDLKLNTLVFQVRPGCDALYASKIEPWSEYLTGTMGKAPEPFYDPLAMAIGEAHKRGLELHAWFNPFRARHAAAKSPVAPDHISRTRPQLVRQYGKSQWLDPGEREVQDYSLSVIMDVVRRYDVDGVHLDDYFYPYKEKDGAGRELEFPDERSWQRYGAGGKLSRDDWRRENVNLFVHRLYDSIKEVKPRVRFGVSPFGIWRPGNPHQIQGYDAYGKLYADSRKWLASGWVDYFAPQLYWAVGAPQQSFPVLLDWWSAQNKMNRLLVPGMDSTKTARAWPPGEIIEQIQLARKNPGTGGHVHWNMSALMHNGSLVSALEREVYAEAALVPPMPWVRCSDPGRPTLTAQSQGGSVEASWERGGEELVFGWVLQTRSANKWKMIVLPSNNRGFTCSDSAPEVIAMSALGRGGNLSAPAVVQLK